MSAETAHFYVFGRVQGVGYRAWTVRIALRLGISGWVRNRHNGCVEIYAQGKTDALSFLRKSCLQGPLWSRVSRLEAVSVPDGVILPIRENTFYQAPTV